MLLQLKLNLPCQSLLIPFISIPIPISYKLVYRNLVWKTIKFLPFAVSACELLEEMSKNVMSKEDSACSHNVAVDL
jgi:hypothetical protein